MIRTVLNITYVELYGFRTYSLPFMTTRTCHLRALSHLNFGEYTVATFDKRFRMVDHYLTFFLINDEDMFFA